MEIPDQPHPPEPGQPDESRTAMSSTPKPSGENASGQNASGQDAGGRETNTPASENSGKSFSVLRTWARDLFFCVVISFFFILFLYQPVKVEGGSMEPGLEDQERIFINKLVYRMGAIERGDIVVLRYPRDPRKSFIKRVIGLPGDHIRLAQGNVCLNGNKLDEPYVPSEYLDYHSYSEIDVPEDHYFVLGDHRSASQDSRDFGPVTRGNIYGKAVFGYWPMEKMGAVK